jgi:LCP family protein required for cell wall assembly
MELRMPNSLRNRWTRALALVAVLSLLVIAGAGVGGWLYLRSFDSEIRRVDAFERIPAEQRPAPDEAVNFLVIGTDQAEQPGAAQRSDSILLVHVPPSQDRAYVISIPRDTWVDVPTASAGDQPRSAKINAAYAWGGAPLLVRTVEGFTGVRIDHVAVVDFAGFAEIIDGLGGIEVVVDAPFTSIAAGGTVLPPGTHRMNGAVALEYARERHQFADGDFSRIRHQQAIFTAVLQEVTRVGILVEPVRLNTFVRGLAGAVQIDAELAVGDTAWRLRRIRADRVTTLTSPTDGVGMIGDQSVVLPDRPAAAELYQAVKNDELDHWLMENPQ